MFNQDDALAYKKGFCENDYHATTHVLKCHQTMGIWGGGYKVVDGNKWARVLHSLSKACAQLVQMVCTTCAMHLHNLCKRVPILLGLVRR